MPTYEYACRDCGHNFDIVQSFADDALTACPSCGGDLRKVFSAAGIIFKGSGYYVTDSRSEPVPSGEGDKKPKTGDSTAPAKPSEPAPSSAGSQGSGSSTPSPGKPSSSRRDRSSGGRDATSPSKSA